MSTRLPSRLTRAVAGAAFAGVLVAGCTDSKVNGASDTPGPTATSRSNDAATGRPAPSSTTTSTSSSSSSTRTSTTDDTEVADAPAACDLITEDDAAGALGEPVVAGDQSQDECWWSSKNELKTVNIIRRTGDIEQWRRGYQNDYWVKVDRGDEGYAGKALDSIVWRIGETTYEVNVVYSTKGNPNEVVVALADKALSRL